MSEHMERGGGLTPNQIAWCNAHILAPIATRRKGRELGDVVHPLFSWRIMEYVKTLPAGWTGNGAELARLAMASGIVPLLPNEWGGAIHAALKAGLLERINDSRPPGYRRKTP
jgi:hypothetical protein